jgi:ZIP family zinc transporter
LRARDRLHLVLGFSAGVLLGIVAFDLLPEVFDLSGDLHLGVPIVMLTFVAGFLELHVVERSVAIHGAHEEEYGEHAHPNVGLVSALALSAHSFMDGVAIGLGFQVGNGVGVIVAVAVIAHDFADGLNTVTVMRIHRNQPRRSTVLLGLDAIAPVLGAASTLLFHIPHHALGLYLGFFAGFLLYIATADILPEAHARHPSWLTMACTVAGVGAMWAVIGSLP